jgi:hypothetical protein
VRIYSDRPITEEEWLRIYAPHNLEDPDDGGEAPRDRTDASSDTEQFRKAQECRH